MGAWRFRDLFGGARDAPPSVARTSAPPAPVAAPEPGVAPADEGDAPADVELAASPAPAFESTNEHLPEEDIIFEPSGSSAPAPPRRGVDLAGVLPLLRDVDGVVGSIAIGNAGDLLGSDLPRLFDAAAVEALAMRISQLRSALASAGSPLKTASIHYETHALRISQLDGGVLGVLTERGTPAPALVMAERLVGRRLEAALLRQEG